jgi:CHAT domain-containing protein/tetratricopeptide (TPR) repeat protein
VLLLPVLLLTSTLVAQQAEFSIALRAAHTGDAEVALKHLTSILQAYPSFSRAFDQSVKLAARLGVTSKIRGEFERLRADPRFTPYALYGLAVEANERRASGEAEAYARQSMEAAPDFLPAYRLLIQIRPAFAQEDPPPATPEFIRQYMLGAYLLSPLAPKPRQWAVAVRHLMDARRHRPGGWEIDERLDFALQASNRLQEAYDLLKGLQETAVAAQDEDLEAKVLGQLGRAETDLGLYEASAGHLQRSVQLFRDFGMPGEEYKYLATLSSVYLYLGDPGRAIEEAQRALLTARSLPNNRRNVGRTLGFLAEALAEAARYGDAIEASREAIEIARETQDTGSQADQEAGISLVYMALGHHEMALASIKSALDYARVRNQWLEARFQSMLSAILMETGQLTKAGIENQKAIELAHANGYLLAELEALVRGGEIATARRNFNEGRQKFEEARGLAGRANALTFVGRAWNGLGDIYLRRNDFQKAIECFRQVLETKPEARSLALSWPAQAGMGAALAGMRRMEEAAESLGAAIDTVEQIRTSAVSPEERAAFFANKVRIYANMVEVLLARGQQSRAFEYSERARARSFLDLLAGPESGRTGAETYRLKEEMAKLQASASTIEAYERYQSVLWRPRTGRAEEPGSIFGRVAGVREIQQSLPKDSALFEYLLGERAAYVFVVTSESVQVAPLKGTAALTLKVRQLIGLLSRPPERVTVAQRIQLSKELYAELIAPAAALVPHVKDLIIVADGVLQTLPFEVLIEPGEQQAGVAYLIRRFPVRYEPSASALLAMQRRQGQRPALPGMLLAYGDPLEGDGRSGSAVLRESNLRQFDPLPASGAEVRQISSLYPKGQAPVRVGRKATEESLKTDPYLNRYSALHFAVHGFLDEARPQFSSLVLYESRGKAKGREDGLLQAYEIAGLSLKAELVVLSACQTGRGQAVNGEGVASLMRAFLHAGASSVVASLWKVDDRATSELMIEFYRQFRGTASKSKAESLRNAKLKMLQRPEWDHPFYWAAFVLTGAS